jgi:hypothetical protein
MLTARSYPGQEFRVQIVAYFFVNFHFSVVAASTRFDCPHFASPRNNH